MRISGRKMCTITSPASSSTHSPCALPSTATAGAAESLPDARSARSPAGPSGRSRRPCNRRSSVLPARSIVTISSALPSSRLSMMRRSSSARPARAAAADGQRDQGGDGGRFRRHVWSFLLRVRCRSHRRGSAWPSAGRAGYGKTPRPGVGVGQPARRRTGKRAGAKRCAAIPASAFCELPGGRKRRSGRCERCPATAANMGIARGCRHPSARRTGARGKPPAQRLERVGGVGCVPSRASMSLTRMRRSAAAIPASASRRRSSNGAMPELAS